MQEQIQAPSQVVSVVSQIETQLDSVVDTGSDDELFTASYLQGHFAVIVRVLETNPEATLSLLDEQVKTSLAAAFTNGELEQEDQQAVYALWDKLLTQAQ